jgi:hypothetical protein
MMALQLLDLFQTTLSASYTAGGTSLTLASVTGLPGSGDYWIAVYDPSNVASTYEVFKVTGAASGSVIPVVGGQANTTNKNHASGQGVYGSILTAAALTQLKLDAGSGDTPPTVGAFTAINATGVTLVAVSSGLKFTGPSSDSTIVRGYYQAAPTTYPWTKCMGIVPMLMTAGSYGYVGTILRESATSKLIGFWMRAPGAYIDLAAYTYSDPSTYAGTAIGFGTIASNHAKSYLFVTDNGPGGNLVLSVGASSNVDSAHVLYNAARTSYFTVGPDGIGFGGASNGSGYAPMMVITHWA